MSYLEGSSTVQHPDALSKIKFTNACVFITALAGKWAVEVNEEKHDLVTGDSVYVPVGATYSVTARSRFSRFV